MIVGIGIDIVEIDRIARLLKKQPGFTTRILTQEEITRLPQRDTHRLAEYIAGRFAAKEATAKAVGTGIGAKLGFHQVEIVQTETGKPLLQISKEALQKIYGEHSDLLHFHLSITHSKAYAVAQVLIEQA